MELVLTSQSCALFTLGRNMIFSCLNCWSITLKRREIAGQAQSSTVIDSVSNFAQTNHSHITERVVRERSSCDASHVGRNRISHSHLQFQDKVKTINDLYFEAHGSQIPRISATLLRIVETPFH